MSVGHASVINFRADENEMVLPNRAVHAYAVTAANNLTHATSQTGITRVASRDKVVKQPEAEMRIDSARYRSHDLSQSE